MGISFATWMSNFQIRWLTFRRGEKVGTDSSGNEYYRDTKHPLHGRERRWVMYKGEPEASLVPPEWHGWLHHTLEAPIPAGSAYHKPWVRPHEPNHTGTAAAYQPPGHQLSGGKRAKATGDYEAWTPEG
jgi:NADH:ubiquinone oxidoreductase subunit